MKYDNILAINRIMQPEMPVTEFLHLAASSGFSAVELRNDLPDPRVLGGETAEAIKSAAAGTGVGILTVNALQRFNDPALFSAKLVELEALISEAEQVDCRMIVLCPVNDPQDRRLPEQQHADLVAALRQYAPLLERRGIIGLVEPLGFSICSVRFKAQAAAAIAASGCGGQYRIVHDTFHHYLSGETELFPELTGLVHTSGVIAGKPLEEISDDDRILVTPEDSMGNRDQIGKLLSAGYAGPLSYEPFSPSVQARSAEELRIELQESLRLLLPEEI